MKNKQRKLNLGVRLRVFLLSIVLCLSAGTFAQINVKASNEPLKTVLKQVENQVDYTFFYNEGLSDLEKKVTVDIRNADLASTLKQLLKETNLAYAIQGKTIALTAKEKLTDTVTAATTSAPPAATGRKVTGTVKDVQGETLIGVAVNVRGTNKRAATNIDGQFELSDVSPNATLDITYIGMKPQTVQLNGRTDIAVVMNDDDTQLEEIVVTAMGIERKAKSLTYATQKMDNEDLMRVQDANFINSLQGKAAGLSITPNAGGAGGSSKILLRGNKSVLGNNTPLIVLDGIPLSNPVSGQQGIGGGEGMGYNLVSEGSDALSAINPDDIESINILKGANAAALYGSAASNGVLMITTKKGKEGKLSINVTSNATFERPLVLPQLQNTYGAAINVLNMVDLGSWGKKIADTTDAELALGGLTKTPQNYINDFFKTGQTFNNSISISGGTKNVLSYFSYGNSNSGGMVENNRFNRHTISFRQSYNLFSDKVKLDASISYLKQNTANRPGGGVALNPIYHLYTVPRNTDMNHFRTNYVKDGEWKTPTYYYYKSIGDGNYSWTGTEIPLKGPKQNWLYDAKGENNPYWLVNRMFREEQLERVYGYLSGTVKIMDGLNASGRFSIDRSKSTATDKRYATTQTPSGMMPWGEYWQRISQTNEFYLDWMLNYNKEFGDYSVSASGGYTAQYSLGTAQSIGRTQATIEDAQLRKLPTAINVFDVSAGQTGNRQSFKTINWAEGLFFTTQVGYKNKVFVEGSYRQDWYRAFKQFSKSRNLPSNYGYYSLGANALMHEIITLPKFWDYWKVRTSYSEVGNSIPSILFDSPTIDPLTGATSPSPYAYFANPIPEKTKSFEAGFDASFFKNSLLWDVTFYYATMNNNYLLLSVAGKTKPVNTGVIRNRGVETSLSYSMNVAKDFLWKTGVNFSYNDNKILKTYRENGQEMLLDQKIGFGGKIQMRYTEGGKYGDIYITDFARDNNGKILINSNGAPSLHKDKFTKFVGNINSPIMLGWNNTFTYKDATLYFLIGGKIGGKVVSFTEAYLDRYGASVNTGEARQALEAGNMNYKINAEMTLGDLVNNPNVTAANEKALQNYYESVGGDINASQYIYDGTNFRMREISLGYTFRNLLGQSKNLTLSLIGRNLFFLYKNAPVDPETSISTQNGLGNIDIFNMPTSRSLGVAVSVNF